jgi:hypothetical protein
VSLVCFGLRFCITCPTAVLPDALSLSLSLSRSRSLSLIVCVRQGVLQGQTESGGTRSHILGRECSDAVLPDRALYLPTFSHLLIAINLPSSRARALSLPPSLPPSLSCSLSVARSLAPTS